MLGVARLLSSGLEVVILGVEWRIYDNQNVYPTERRRQIAEKLSGPAGTNGFGKAQQRR